MRRNGLVAMAAAWLLSACAFGGEEPRIPEISLPFMKKAPAIDGTIGDAEWAGAARMERFAQMGPEAFPGEASFWVGSDGKTLFVAVRSVTGPDGVLEKFQPARINVPVYLDDAVELVFAPDSTDGGGKLYHMIVNNRGAVYAQAQDGKAPLAWRPKAMKTAGKVEDGVWTFEIALPLSDFGLETLPATSGLRVCRNWKRLAEGDRQTSWEAVKTAFMSRAFMPVIHWEPSAPVVQVRQLRAPEAAGGYAIRMTVANPGAKSVAVKADLSVKPKNSAPASKSQTVSAPAGKTVELALDGPAVEGEALETRLAVTSEDGAKTYYIRDYTWSVAPASAADLFLAAGADADAGRVSAQFAYFPTHDRIHLSLNLQNVKDKDSVGPVTATLSDAQGKELAQTVLPAVGADGAADLIWGVPDLKALGGGEFMLTFAGPGLPKEGIAKKFVRNLMEWEGNPLGKSDILVPPFTAIRANGDTVSTILRDHAMSPEGLWAQVTAADRPLLKAGGMRLEAAADGKKVPVKAAPAKVLASTDTSRVTEVELDVGGAKATATSRWDYDGVMKWTLAFAPGAARLDSLKLVIPLDDGQMPLMHTCADGIRINYGGATPKGAGKVWDGNKAAHNSIIGSYVPYIWLGGELRGIAVFGENDKGWETDDDAPCQELIRDGGTLSLVLNLFAKPAALNAERKIVVGFQATPVKPMPGNWRRWSMWGVGGGMDLKRFVDMQLSFMGSCYVWGADGPCTEIYPRNHDLTLWDELGETRRTGNINKDFVEQWLAGYRPAGEPGSDAQRAAEKVHRDHINYAFHTAAGAGARGAGSGAMLAYLNARGVRWDTPEGRTFADEWHRFPFINRNFGFGAGVAYDLDPVESYRDYAMWYYRKFLESGATDLLYWDDIFMQSNFSLVGTEAYRRADGAVQPASGLWNMRELVRRAAVLQTEMGISGPNMVHMTNTAIAPICSFAGMNYDWEDGDGVSDFQDRYTREYIRALSIGRQFGNFPAVLAVMRAKTPEEFARCVRTAAGVMLTHELRWTRGDVKAYWETLGRLYDFGYGRDDARVHNYWDGDYPAKVTGLDTSSVVVARNGEAMVLVCDYGGGGKGSVALDAAALKLPAAFAAVNEETGKELPVAGGAVEIELAKHDFVLLRVKGK